MSSTKLLNQFLILRLKLLFLIFVFFFGWKLQAQVTHVGPTSSTLLSNSYGPLKRLGQDPDRVGFYYSACELGLMAGVNIDKFIFELDNASGLPANLPAMNLKVKNQAGCSLNQWTSWELATSNSQSYSGVVPELSNTGTQVYVTFYLASPFNYTGRGLELYFENVDTSTYPIHFIGYQSPGNIQFWSGNYVSPINTNYKPVMDIQFQFASTPTLPTNTNLNIVSCDNLYEVCIGEPICLTLVPAVTATQPIAISSGLQVKWFYGSTNIQFSSGSTSAAFDMNFTPGDPIKCQILNAGGTILRTKTIFTTNWVVLDNPDDPFACYPEEPAGTEVGSRITEVTFSKKSDDGIFHTLLKSQTNMDGANAYMVQANPTLALPFLQFVQSGVLPVVNEFGTYTDFTQFIQSGNAIPEVRMGDTLKLELRMSKAAKPNMFNHIAKIDVDWNADFLTDSSYI